MRAASCQLSYRHLVAHVRHRANHRSETYKLVKQEFCGLVKANTLRVVMGGFCGAGCKMRSCCVGGGGADEDVCGPERWVLFPDNGGVLLLFCITGECHHVEAGKIGAARSKAPISVPISGIKFTHATDRCCGLLKCCLDSKRLDVRILLAASDPCSALRNLHADFIPHLVFVFLWLGQPSFRS